METLKDIFGDFARPLRVLVVALVGIFFAMQILNDDYLVVGGWLLVALFIAASFDYIGQLLLPEYPKEGLFFMEFWVLAPAVIAAIASGFAVIVTLELAPDDAVPADAAAILKASATALTTFLTSGFVSWVGEKDDSRVASRIKRHFQKYYLRAETFPIPDDNRKYFNAESRAERAIHSFQTEGIDGWGLSGRWARARILVEELKSGDSDPVDPNGAALKQ